MPLWQRKCLFLRSLQLTAFGYAPDRMQMQGSFDQQCSEEAAKWRETAPKTDFPVADLLEWARLL